MSKIKNKGQSNTALSNENQHFFLVESAVVQKIVTLPGFLNHSLSVDNLNSYLKDYNFCTSCLKPLNIKEGFVFTRDFAYFIQQKQASVAFSVFQIPPEGKGFITEDFHFLFNTYCSICHHFFIVGLPSTKNPQIIDQLQGYMKRYVELTQLLGSRSKLHAS